MVEAVRVKEGLLRGAPCFTYAAGANAVVAVMICRELRVRVEAP